MMISYYRIAARANKWAVQLYLSLSTWFAEFRYVCCKLKTLHDNKPLSLLNFLNEVGDALQLSNSRALSSPRNSVGKPQRLSDQSYSKPPPQKRKTTE